MAGGFEQIHPGNVGRDHGQIAAFHLFALQEVLEDRSQHRALGSPEGQAGAHRVSKDKQPQVFAQFAVIAFEGFFLAAFVFGQLLWRFPSRAIDSLELGLGGIAAPIGSGHGFQFDRLGVNFRGVFQVGAGAKIPPLIAQVINRDRFGFDVVEDFQLVRLPDRLNPALGFLAGHLFANHRQLFVDDFDHLFFDRLQRLFTEGFGAIKIVVKAVFDPGADRHLSLGKQALHRHGHHVGSGVANFFQRFRFASFRQGDFINLVGGGQGTIGQLLNHTNETQQQ